MAGAGTGDVAKNNLHKVWLDLSRRSSLFSSGRVEFRIGDEPGFRVLYEDARGILEDMWWACWALADRVRRDKWMLLIACMVVDLIGLASYLLLIIGEVIDIWWAPMCAFFLHFMFGSMLMSSFGAIEEILPLTDLMPTATICWCITHTRALGFVRNAIGIKRYPAIDISKAD